MSLAIANRTTGDLITASIWNTDLVATLNLLDPTTSTITTTGTQTALALPIGDNELVIFANNATLLTLQGITAGIDGQQLTIFSIGAGQVDLANQNGSAAAANRIVCGVTGTISLAAGVGHVMLEYDVTAARWRVCEHEQGAWITPAFAAGDYTGSGSLVVTVAAGDVSTYAYYLKGRTLFVVYRIITITISGTGSIIKVAIPNSLMVHATRTFDVIGRVIDNGATAIPGLIEAGPGLTYVSFYVDVAASATNWSASTDLTTISGEIVFEVQ